MTADHPDRSPADDRVTFSLRRTHLFAGIGLVVGFALGFLVARGGGDRDAGPAGIPPLAAAQPGLTPPPRAPVDIPVDGRPARGPSDAPVTIVEFTDYQCPFCRQHFDLTLGPLLEEYGDRVRYIVMNYPIPQLHPDAVGAAEAAECAADQDQFWPYHDRLFQADAHDEASLKQYARELGLDGQAFDTCLDDGTHADRVRDHVQLGNASGVAGTPAFFVNGRMIEGAMPFDVFAMTIEEALNDSK